jgi:lipopolysaccharide export system protein LptA
VFVYVCLEPYQVRTEVADQVTVLSRSAVVLDRRGQGGVATLTGAIAAFDPETGETVQTGSGPVTVLRGRTTATGTELVYETDTGLGRMTGPVAVARDAGEDGEALTGESQALSFDVDRELLIFSGQVKLTSGSRQSEADTATLDEATGVIILEGNPAVSRDGSGGEVKGRSIRYLVDADEVEVLGDAEATLEIEGEGFQR